MAKFKIFLRAVIICVVFFVVNTIYLLLLGMADNIVDKIFKTSEETSAEISVETSVETSIKKSVVTSAEVATDNSDVRLSPPVDRYTTYLRKV